MNGRYCSVSGTTLAGACMRRQCNASACMHWHLGYASKHAELIAIVVLTVAAYDCWFRSFVHSIVSLFCWLIFWWFDGFPEFVLIALVCFFVGLRCVLLCLLDGSCCLFCLFCLLLG